MNCRRINVNLMGGIWGPAFCDLSCLQGRGARAANDLDMGGSVDDESFRYYTAL